MNLMRHLVLRILRENINTPRSVPARYFSKSNKLLSNEISHDIKLFTQQTQPEDLKHDYKNFENLPILSDVNIEESKFIETQDNLTKYLQSQKSTNIDDSDSNYSEFLSDGLPNPLEPYNEDLSHIGSCASPTFNFAAYADKSETLQQLVDMGVNLHLVEGKKNALEIILPLNFKRDVEPYIKFLCDNGLPADCLRYFFTHNPYIFKEDLDHLNTRIKYLQAHNFNPRMIQQILSEAPMWINYTTKNIDKRLAYFQHTFHLNGHGVRRVATACPRLILAKMQVIVSNTFAFKEEMGFNQSESKAILLKLPVLFRKGRHKIVGAFDYVHNKMQISHQQIVNEPHVLLCRPRRLEWRHKFLKQLQRDQFDAKKPLYVSLRALVAGTDAEFCKNVARTTIDTYNDFLKTL